jgi:pimeloyl-ACP methyl ester carboxylesterase
MILTWRLLLDGLPAGLSGRGRAFLLVALAVSAGVLGVVRIGYSPSLISGRLQGILPWLPGALALAFVAKGWTACWSFSRAHRRRLMSARLVFGYLAFWLAATGLIIALPGVLFADIPWLRHLGALATLSAVPVARVGLSALALDRNRHRSQAESGVGPGPDGRPRVRWRGRAILAVGLVFPCGSFLLAGQVADELPGRVDAGGHRLRMLVAGRGSPTVILETSGMAPLECWSRVQPAVSRFARVVAYDHAGYWGSEAGPKPRDARRVARELHAALRDARIAPPYVLVGYSFGGPFARVFADLYPDEVVGLVLVDPSQEAAFDWVWAHHPEVNRITDEDVARQDEWGCTRASLDQARAARIPPGLAVTLITCIRHDGSEISRETMPVWLAAHGLGCGASPAPGTSSPGGAGTGSSSRTPTWWPGRSETSSIARRLAGDDPPGRRSERSSGCLSHPPKAQRGRPGRLVGPSGPPESDYSLTRPSKVNAVAPVLRLRVDASRPAPVAAANRPVPPVTLKKKLPCSMGVLEARYTPARAMSTWSPFWAVRTAEEATWRWSGAMTFEICPENRPSRLATPEMVPEVTSPPLSSTVCEVKAVLPLPFRVATRRASSWAEAAPPGIVLGVSRRSSDSNWICRFCRPRMAMVRSPLAN